MFRRVVLLVFAGVLSTSLTGVVFPGCGGLSRGDFEKISLNGFDPEDEAEDKNSYAWSMEHYMPDGADTGYVYVGTGNNLGGLLSYGVGRVLAGEDPREGAPIRPPEIRRYRPDQGPTSWERVLDYRDVEDVDELGTIGFRYMTSYRGEDGTLHLYAASMGEVPILWRSATGEPGTWEEFFRLDTGSIRWMEEHRGLLYLALATDIPGTDLVRTGRILATDGTEVWSVIDDGFGNPDNIEVECLASFNGWLYAGTLNQTTGYEIWKFAGPQGDETPVLVVKNGGPDSRNDIAGTPKIFKGHLYMGSLIFQGGFNVETFNGFKGFDIIRIDKNDRWETVVGPDSLSGFDSGFNYFTNAYNWTMGVHDGWLYASSFDQSAMLQGLFSGRPLLIPLFLLNWDTGQVFPCCDKGVSERVLFEKWTPGDYLFNSGADLYKTNDGVRWWPVFQDGLGNRNNYGVRTMLSVGDDFYLGTANNRDGLEIWRANTAEPEGEGL